MKRLYILSIVVLCGMLLCGIHLLAQDDHEGHDHTSHQEIDDHSGHDHASHAETDDDHSGHDHASHAETDDDHSGHDHGVHPEQAEQKESAGHEDHSGHDHGAHGDSCDDADPDVVEISSAQQQEIGLKIDVAAAGSVDRGTGFVGEIKLHDEQVVHLYPMVEGIVNKVNVSLGDRVSQGDILALIDSSDFAELKADYLEKTQNLELARRTFERKEYLLQENIASEADFLEAKAAYKTAQTLVRSARRRLTVLGLTSADIKRIGQESDVEFGRYRVRSPIDGSVIYKHISRGEMVGDEEIFIVADLSQVWVDMQIPARDLAKVAVGQQVTITSTEGMTARGDLILVGPVVDPESRTALGRVVLSNSTGAWKPGIFVQGQITGGTHGSSVIIAAQALQNIDGDDVVFVPVAHGYRAVQVTPGKRDRNNVEIVAGLQPGDQYVSQGAFELKSIRITSGLDPHAGHNH